MIEKIRVKEHLYSIVVKVFTILINQDFIKICTLKFEENWIDEVWNIAFEFSTIAVLD